MINKGDKQVDLEFGKGDICIAGGHYLDRKGEKIGLVTFTNQEEREIGSVGIIKGGGNYKVGEFPVIMTFPKKESIDVVIEQLIQAKESMEG